MNQSKPFATFARLFALTFLFFLVCGGIAGYLAIGSPGRVAPALVAVSILFAAVATPAIYLLLIRPLLAKADSLHSANESIASERDDLALQLEAERRAHGRSEDQYRQLVDCADVIILRWDSSGLVTFINRFGDRFFGFPDGELIGKNVLDTIVPPTESLTGRDLAEMISDLSNDPDAFSRNENENIRADGRRVWISWTNTALRDESGRASEMLSIGIDITDQRRIAEQLKEAKEEAETANMAKSTFLANMSHEIRTPLNAIVGYSQLMSRLALDDTQQGYLDTIVRSSEHLLAIINDILDLARIESGRATVSSEDFDFNQLLRDLSNMFQLRAREKGLKLDVGQVDASVQYLRADEGKLRQVLINLISNAVKFTERGTITLTPRLDELGEEGGVLEVAVKDTGPGIPPEDIGGLFDAFVQTATGRAVQGGTGLGLAISRKLALSMDGDLVAESTLGAGSLFTLSLHVRAAKDTVSDRVRQRDGAMLRLAAGSPTYRVLVADDVMENRNLVVEQLSPIGFDVYEAGNGEEAVRLFDDCAPDLVLMDMGMPVMDGYEATMAIKATERGRKTPVIAMTARVLSDNRDGILAAGVDDFLGKPFHDHELLEIIGKHLGVSYEDISGGGEPAGDSIHATEQSFAESMRNLDPELRASFRDAVQSGRVKVLGTLIAELAKSNTIVAPELQKLVDNYQYRRILELLSE